MRHKIPDDKKKKKFSISVDIELLDIFDEYLDNKKFKNKSKYIEYLIRKDMEEKGENIKKEF